MRVLIILYCCPVSALGICCGAVVTQEVEQEYPWHVALVHYAREPGTNFTKLGIITAFY